MRAVVQRVSQASVTVSDKKIAQIGIGYLILLGVEDADSMDDAEWLVRKILSLRIFSDEEGKMNLDIAAVSGDVIVVSQFTLHAKTRKGNRPSFIRAAQPEKANELYEAFCELVSIVHGRECQKGEFGAHMEVSLVNDGPVTIIIDTKNKE